MDFIEATPLPTECRCCQETDCYNCDHASKRWTLSKKQELLLLRKLKEKAILRFKRQIEEIDYQIAMMEEAKREHRSAQNKAEYCMVMRRGR